MEKESILIDTNVFIDHLRNFKPAVAFFESIIGRPNIFFSAITETELFAGKENNDLEKREKLLHFVYQWNKIKVDNPLAAMAGDISRKYGLSVPDAIIAASAIINDLTLITRNIKDFDKVQNLSIKSPY